ncbi:MAG: hypothetical protein M3159_08860 [Actinomycetota bacterium]|nr:hypothetical protein [Actinomycetota bacterium]
MAETGWAWTGLRRAGAGALVATAILVVTAAPADAHTITGTKPTDYQSQILSVAPALAGLSLRLLDLGNKVELTNATGNDIVVLGSDGQPLGSVGPGGRVRSGHTAKWRDQRTRWEGADPPAVRAAPGVRHVVSQWSIPLQAGDMPVVVLGRITWVPGASAVPWLLAALGLFAITVSLAWTRHWGPALAAALAVLIAVDAVHSFASAAAGGDSVVVTIARVLGLGFLSTLAWLGGVWAIGRLQRKNELGLLVAALGGFVIGLYSLSDTTILGRSQVAYAFASVAARAAVSLSLGVGFGLVVAVVMVFKHNPGLVTQATET